MTEAITPFNPTSYAENERELVYRSVCMYRNWLETGDVILSATDARNSGRADIIKSLSVEQMKIIIELDRIQIELLSPRKKTTL
jgi:hypothetical protein